MFLTHYLWYQYSRTSCMRQPKMQKFSGCLWEVVQCKWLLTRIEPQGASSTHLPDTFLAENLLCATSNGLFQKKSTAPRRMGSFFNPPSHLDFLKHKTPPPNWISKVEDPPSRLDFREKNKRLKFNLFLMENTRKHV